MLEESDEVEGYAARTDAKLQPAPVIQLRVCQLRVSGTRSNNASMSSR